MPTPAESALSLTYAWANTALMLAHACPTMFCIHLEIGSLSVGCECVRLLKCSSCKCALECSEYEIYVYGRISKIVGGMFRARLKSTLGCENWEW